MSPHLVVQTFMPNKSWIPRRKVTGNFTQVKKKARSDGSKPTPKKFTKKQVMKRPKKGTSQKNSSFCS